MSLGVSNLPSLRKLSRFGLAVRRYAGRRTDVDSSLLRTRTDVLSLSSSKIAVYGHCDIALTINDTLKWLTQLPVLLQSQSGGDSAASSCWIV